MNDAQSRRDAVPHLKILWWRLQLTSGGPTRWPAAVSLARSGDPRGLEALKRDLNAFDRSVCFKAIEALSDLGAVEILAALMQGSDDFVLREKAAQAIAKMKRPEAQEPLATAFRRQDQAYSVRRSAARALNSLRWTRLTGHELEKTIAKALHA